MAPCRPDTGPATASRHRALRPDPEPRRPQWPIRGVRATNWSSSECSEREGATRAAAAARAAVCARVLASAEAIAPASEHKIVRGSVTSKKWRALCGGAWGACSVRTANRMWGSARSKNQTRCHTAGGGLTCCRPLRRRYLRCVALGCEDGQRDRAECEHGTDVPRGREGVRDGSTCPSTCFGRTAAVTGQCELQSRVPGQRAPTCTALLSPSPFPSLPAAQCAATGACGAPSASCPHRPSHNPRGTVPGSAMRPSLAASLLSAPWGPLPVFVRYRTR